MASAGHFSCRREREFFIDNLLVRIHFIIEMIWWTGLAPWEFERVVGFTVLKDTWSLAAAV